ncbi:hypothetical protein ES703_114068 [subsurface metagenome]
MNKFYEAKRFVILNLKDAREFRGHGDTSEPVCEIPVELNRIGVILFNGLNPVAAAVEAGIEAENHGMSTVIDYQNLIKFWEL